MDGMTWFFVIWVSVGYTGGTLGMAVPHQEVMMQMPSKEICEAIRVLNHQGECWAKEQKQ